MYYFWLYYWGIFTGSFTILYFYFIVIEMLIFKKYFTNLLGAYKSHWIGKNVNNINKLYNRWKKLNMTH